MKKQELLKIIDCTLLEELFSFCYARTNNSYEAQYLCSDIVFALVKTANTAGEIRDVYPYIWRTARNVYADFCNKRKEHADTFYQGDSEEIFAFIAAEENTDDSSNELLKKVYRQISFLTKAYRNVMIQFYIDGLSVKEIASRQNTSEVAIRQRLFSARKKIRNEVEQMTTLNHKPVSLNTIEYVIWGTGDPRWGDPRSVCTRQFSKHIIWLCRQKPKSASEIADKLNVPTIYVEEELEILTRGSNGEYGFLRRLENGKYAINIILFDKEQIEKANQIYVKHIPVICSVISGFIEKHKEKYLAFPYLNHKIDLNLILWQQIFTISQAFSDNVERILLRDYFADTVENNRPFSIYGYLDYGKYYSGGWNGVDAENICGYSKIHVDNIDAEQVKPHFFCGLNIANDRQIQLAVRAIDGLPIKTLSEDEKEAAAKAVACGYLYREDEMLYTKILVNDIKDSNHLFTISNSLSKNIFEAEAKAVAAEMARFISKAVPEYLRSEWRLANTLAGAPVLDALLECLIENGILTPPKDGVGAEGCWMSVMK